ncbi:squamosa promoter-binding-like protein 1 [Phalaenopsis equestris]|uniref:squamosa promoter-binding-like protein 1 n=1 Tax=Phalaenopsis equestris TaxID=78828 RepID=UPI0009E382E1|nr:squamosa promoter-binding-like protein 1 [Phalaenopsis equestris]
MEANMRGDIHQFFTTESSNGHKQKTQEWDLNEWKWDGERFVAAPVTPGSLDYRNKQPFHGVVVSNTSSAGSDEFNFGIVGKGLGETDKRRRILVVGDDKQCDEVGSLTLKIGGHVYPVRDEDLEVGGMKNGKRGMVQASNLNIPKCQVEGCGADLSNFKDYYRRHKLCEMHAKASSVALGNVMQRFCQQCSRFHLLQEFDERKRSCRQSLRDHNDIRKKKHSVVSPIKGSAADNQSTNHLLISVLKILGNLSSDKFQHSKDSELLWNFVKNIAPLACSSDTNKISRLLQASHDIQKVGTSAGISGEVADALLSGVLKPSRLPAKTKCAPTMATNQCAPVSAAPREMQCQLEALCSLQHMLPAAGTVEDERTMGFDLNAPYVEEPNGELGCEKPSKQATAVNGSPNCSPWVVKDCHQSNQPQICGNPDSTSTRSLSSSNGDAQSRTDRIVFKLFGKDPNDLPLALRAQIFDWLSHSPTDMESYIRPGCIILTVYLRLSLSAWDELCHDLVSSLNKLICLSADNFWQSGWICARLQHQLALIYNGQVVLNKSLVVERNSYSKILSVTPIAAPPCSRVTFNVKVSNLVRSTTRLHCAFEGRYLSQEIDQTSVYCSNNERNHEQIQFLSFSCRLSDAIGQGFIEIEDDGLSSVFFPFIVAEEDVCTEIRMLESSIDLVPCDEVMEEKLEAARSLGVNFLHEMGWLLRRSHLSSKSDSENYHSEAFSLARFRWILRFSVDRDWSAIVRKLLNILFDGIIDLGGISPTIIALSENLLHYAVQRNSKLTVKLLLRYKPCRSVDRGIDNLFRPDMAGPSNITPLHVAATSIHAESMLDLLTDDPGQFGLKAWKNAHDNSGFTPEDYAIARGHQSYITLMQKKINKNTQNFDFSVNIPSKSIFTPDPTHKQSKKQSGLDIEKNKSKLSQPPFCKFCEHSSTYRSSGGSSLMYRPMLLSMLGIAAVCVCVALLFKGPPEVLFVYPPFRWELLEYGFM